MKTTLALVNVAALTICVAALSSSAQTPGYYDDDFAYTYANGPVFTVVTTSAGYIWMGGYFNSVDNSYHVSEDYVSANDTYFDLAVLNTNGGLTTGVTYQNYSSAIEAATGDNCYVGAMAIDSNDVVFVAFNPVRSGSAYLARFDPNGAGSWTFNSGYGATTQSKFSVIYSLAADGAITYVATESGLVELDYSGNNTGYTLPPTLISGYTFDVNQVRYLPMSAGFTNNSLLICGGCGVARISTTGTNVYQQGGPYGTQSWCAATRTDVQQAACPDPLGELVAGGAGSPYDPAGFYENSGTVDGFFMDRYGFDATNSIITNTAGDNFSICRVDAGPTGDLILCGYFAEINGSSANGFAHLLANGSVDSTFYNYTSIAPFDMAIQPDGKIVLGGEGQYTDFSVFGSVLGYVERHYGLSSATNFTPAITAQPTPTNQTLYVGDPVFYEVAVSAAGGYTLQWMQNSTNLPGQTGAALSFDISDTNQAGVYQLEATSAGLCGGSADSSNAYLTVLPAPPPPPNDDFANADVLTGLDVTTNGYVRSSTFESGEPDPTGDDEGYSVWYTWTAPTNCTVTLDVSGSDFASALAVYTGNAVNSLTMITNNCNEVSDGEGGYYCNGLVGAVTFTAAAGMTYQIQIGGPPNPGSLGDISLVLTTITFQIASSWQTLYSNPNLVFYTAATGCGTLVAGGYDSSQSYAQVVASASYANLTNWTIQLPGLQDIEEVTFAKDRYFIGGDDVLVESTDAQTWFSNDLAGLNLSNIYIEESTYAAGNYVTVAENGVILSSLDALTWTLEATNIAYESDDYLWDVTYGKGLFVAVGDDCSIVTSPDGTIWTLTASQIGANEGDSLYTVAYGHGLFVAAGNDILTSCNGTNWSLQSLPPGLDNGFYNIAYGAGLFVGVGGTSDIWISPDGTNWFPDSSGVSAELYGVAYYTNGQFLVAGENGTLLLNKPPSFTPAVEANGGVVLTLIGLSGATAVIQSTPSLSPANWQPVYTNTILHGSISYTNNPALPAQFFRAVVQ